MTIGKTEARASQPRGRKCSPTRPTSARKQRQCLEAALERLLAAAEAILADLDAIDGDPDLEAEHDGREPDVDDEPSLGAPEPTTSEVAFAWPGAAAGEGAPWRRVTVQSFDPLDQRRWATTGSHDDLEDQCDDEGGACEDEGHDSDAEGDAQATCQHFRDGEGRVTWPPTVGGARQ